MTREEKQNRIENLVGKFEKDISLISKELSESTKDEEIIRQHLLDFFNLGMTLQGLMHVCQFCGDSGVSCPACDVVDEEYDSVVVEDEDVTFGIFVLDAEIINTINILQLGKDLNVDVKKHEFKQKLYFVVTWQMDNQMIHQFVGSVGINLINRFIVNDPLLMDSLGVSASN